MNTVANLVVYVKSRAGIGLLVSSLTAAAYDEPPLPVPTFSSSASVVNFGGDPRVVRTTEGDNAGAQMSYSGGFGIATGYSSTFFNYASSALGTLIPMPDGVHNYPNLILGGSSLMTVYFRITSSVQTTVKIDIDVFSQSIVASNYDLWAFYNSGSTSMYLSGATGQQIGSYGHDFCPVYLVADERRCQSGTDRSTLQYTLATNSDYKLTFGALSSLSAAPGLQASTGIFTSAAVSLDLGTTDKSFANTMAASDYTLEVSPGFTNQLNTSPVPEPASDMLLLGGLVGLLGAVKRKTRFLRS